MQLVKVTPKRDFDTFVSAMFLIWARAPRNPNPDLDGSFNLGEIGAAPEKSWTKATPYSLSQPKESCSE
jgi:hypothetical protein